MSSVVSNYVKKLLLEAGINLKTDTGVKLMLLGTGYTPNPDHKFISDIVASELSGTGYAGGFGGSGRKAVAGRATSQDDSGDAGYLDFNDQTWTAINAGTVGAVALVKEITTDGDSLVIATDDISNSATNGGDWTYQVANNGFLKIA